MGTASLAAAAQDLLAMFMEANAGVKPEALICYRDGVSSGQYGQVLVQEYAALRQVSIGLNPNP